MVLETLIPTYGYWILLLGTFLEGETVLIIAGFLAHQRYFSLPLVIIIAFIGAFIGDELFFFIGRLKGKRFLEKHRRINRQAIKVEKILEKFGVLFVVGFRFMYGMRVAAALVFGASKVKTGKFIFLNAIGAMLWAGIIGTLGYFFGAALKAFLGKIKHIELEIILGIITAGIIIKLVKLLICKHKNNNS